MVVGRLRFGAETDGILAVLVVLIVAVATMAAYIYADGRPKVYGGQFKVIYQNGQATSAEQIQLDHADPTRAGREHLHPQTGRRRVSTALETLNDHVSASVDGVSNVLTVTVSDADPTRASGVGTRRRGELHETSLQPELDTDGRGASAAATQD